ncbi:MAG: TldD/PmbA family protein [Candidatus Azobacteroides sp.]|nr:TldD/PmbA family protein [Candidatus Azobacteroides sp.]
MISQQYKELAQWALKFALDNGCSDARISIYSGTNNSLEYRDTQLDKLEQSSENAMNIQLFVDGRYASYSTNRMDKRELDNFIIKGIETTRLLEKDEFRKLPDSNRYYKGAGKGLDVYDNHFDKVSVDDKIALLKASNEEVFGSDFRLISVSSNYEDGIANSYMVSSNGFEGENESTYFSLSSETVIKDKGDARPSSYWYDSSIFWNQLQKKSICKTAYERTLRKLGQEKIVSGIYPMLVDNTQITQLLSPLIAALYGSAIQQKNSFLIGKLGETIVSGKLTLIDDPHISQARGARWYDGEGVATKKSYVIENGTLKMYYIDTYYGAKMNMEPTIQSPSVLTCRLGDKNFDQLLASMKKGIWVTGFNGGNSNSTTGDFSFGIEGFLIENGEAVKPLSEMNITGNLLSLWKNIVEIGNDPMLISSWRIPSVIFDEINFSGK